MIWDIALNYDGFRAIWQEVLGASEMRAFVCPARETLDLSRMSRTHETHVLLGPRRGRFTVGARLSWTWNALLSARTATTEEDLLMELSAWEGINLPRHWDDPDREPEEGPEEQVADLIERVWEAIQEWDRCLSHLLPATSAPGDRSEA